MNRIKSFDGLRGLAATVVVIHHFASIIGGSQEFNYLGHPLQVLLGLWIYVGHLAVWAFFVLSGFVLSQAYSAWGRENFTRFTLARLARIYIPTWGAVALFVVAFLSTPKPQEELGEWVSLHPEELTIFNLIQDVTLVTGPSRDIAPLWSLQWEILFSLLLPVYCLAGSKINGPLRISLAVLLSTCGELFGSEVLKYMPMFAIGVALHLRNDAANRRNKVSDMFWTKAMLFVGILGLLGAPVFFTPLDLGSIASSAANVAAPLAGVTLLVLAAGERMFLGRIWVSTPILWLGKVSFSLYLTHEIVLLTFARTTNSNLWLMLFALVLCFPAAFLFHKAIEGPAHALSRRIGHPN